MHSWPPPPPADAVTQRLRGMIVERLREMIGELELFATSWQAAGVCAAALARTLGARAVVIHEHDPRTREARVIGAEGGGARDLLGATHAADDDLVARHLGAGRPTLRLPVMTARGCVAIIEVVDTDDTLAQMALDACQCAADALAQFHMAHATAA